MSSVVKIHAGRTLGRYELLIPLAQGGTASVWAAKMRGTRGFEKIVAVKAMLAEYEEADLDAESMFLDEARVVSRIRHPNVAEVLDLGEEDGALYIVMEWVEGEALHVVVREAKAHGGLPLALAVRVCALACGGLHAAHELRDDEGKLINLVHRDVSPQNILVGYDGSVKVIDFGVAKSMTSLQRTSVGQLKGKVPYMSPEQAMGMPVDRRTDVFAMGIVLYQLVTGKHPFRGDNEFVTLARIRDKNPPDAPIKLVPDLSPALDAAILKALSKDREARFNSMIELRRAIEEAVPLPQDRQGELAVFMRSILAKRAEKKSLAIREALKYSNEGAKTAAPRPPVSLLDDDLEAAPKSAASSSSAIAATRAVVQAATAANASPAAPAAAAPATRAAPASKASEPRPNFKRGTPTIALVAVGFTLLVAAVLAILSARGGGSGTPEAPAPKKAW